MALPVSEWLTTLGEMEKGLDAALAALDAYKTRWEGALAGATEPPPAVGAAAGLEERLRGWDARLAAAGELAAAVEKQLAEREAAVTRWGESFTGWRELLQRPVDPAPPAAGPAG